MAASLAAGGCFKQPAEDLPGPHVAAAFFTLPTKEVGRAVDELERAGLWRVAPPSARARPLTSSTYADLARDVGPAVVHVFSRLTLVGSFYDDPLGVMPFRIWLPVPHRGTSLGSGFHVGRGYVVTSRTTLASGKEIAVLFADGSSYDARLVGDIPATDVALLRIADPPERLPVVSLGRSDSTPAGERIAVVASPSGYGHSVHEGIVTFRGTRLRVDETQPAESGIALAQLSARLGPGEAGAPVVDLAGAVVGMAMGVNAHPEDEPTFALPVEVLEQSIAYLLMQAPMELPIPVDLPPLPELPLPGR